MSRLISLVIAGASSAALAQAPAENVMPDGSRDLYLGLGIESTPRYEGAGTQKTHALPAIQIEWANGIFLSGLSAGMHLSHTPGIEFGPLVAIDPGHSDAANETIGSSGTGAANASPGGGPLVKIIGQSNDRNPRPEMGGFFNYYFAEHTRLTSSLLYGSGEHRNGILLDADAQQTLTDFLPHQVLSLSAGLTWANGAYNASYFGLPTGETAYRNAPYVASAGVKDIHLVAHWRLALSNTWLLVSQVSGARLMGSAKDSPIVSRHDNVTVSAALAYRF